MARLYKSRRHKIGVSPGTLVHIGEKKVEKARITIVDYDQQSFEQKQLDTPESLSKYADSPTISWVNIDGLHDVQLIQQVGETFKLHPLTLEDILSTGQRPKLEEFDDYLYLVLKMVDFDANSSEVSIEQISLILGKSYVLSFQERPGDVFEPVRMRLRQGKSRIRKTGSDYLLYALADAIVDHYFIVLEALGDEIEKLEEEVITVSSTETLQHIYQLKREMLLLRKSIWPLREVVGNLERDDYPLMREKTALYLRDLYDHTIQVVDTIETYRDMLAGLLDVYLSSLSNKMNEVMKVLTIIATLFIPLTFIAGIYGMNFKYMPELEWRFGYFAVWGLMLVLALFMVLQFRRKKWL